MALYKRKSSKYPVNAYLRNIKYVENYKYLGTTMSYNLSTERHLEELSQRACHLQKVLTPFRLHAPLRLCVNLFICLINPHFRLIGALWDLSSNHSREKITKLYKRRWKSFLCLPKSTPN